MVSLLSGQVSSISENGQLFKWHMSTTLKVHCIVISCLPKEAMCHVLLWKFFLSPYFGFGVIGLWTVVEKNILIFVLLNVLSE